MLIFLAAKGGMDPDNFAHYQISQETRKRIQIMVDSTDGFEIAEQDLKLRGPGDLEGTAQSGMAFDLKVANLARDGMVLQAARDLAHSHPLQSQ